MDDYGFSSGVVGTDMLPFFLHDSIKKYLPNISFTDVSPLWDEVTYLKEPEEIDIMRKAISIAQIGMKAGIDSIREGKTEIEISAEAEYAMRKHGSEVLPFVPVILSGHTLGMCARVATPKKVKDGEIVTLDLGCVYRGYVGEFGRSVMLGKPSEKAKRYYQTVYHAIKRIESIAKPGVPCKKLDEAAREVFDEFGFSSYKPRRAVGHQLGYGLHGRPAIGPDVDVPLQQSMVFNVEPSLRVYDDFELGGAHIEDTFLVTENGVERLTDFPYDERLL